MYRFNQNFNDYNLLEMQLAFHGLFFFFNIILTNEIYFRAANILLNKK